jgi:branched-chain amino acid transport system ATP-binding protein
VSLLRCEGVTKYFGGLRALDGVDLTVESGEIVGLVGPNGSGKTTLMNAISGSFGINAGSVVFDAQDMTRMRPHQRAHLGIARTFQIPKPLPSLSVIDNVALAYTFGRDQVPMGRARGLAADLLAELDLADKANAPVAHLNLHERKLLGIARALGLEPRLLLLDEVLAGLNPTEVDLGLAMIRAVRDRGVAVIYIEHNVKAVTSISDRLYVLNRGKNLVDGDPRDVVADNRVVAAYLGEAHADPA